jgi:WD40 repeat protein
LKAGGGLRVYRTTDYALVFSERYPETSTWVEFDKSGRIITTCYDGKVRLYDEDFKLLGSKEMPEGRRPDSLSFSPDGTQIAVGYDEPEAQDPRWPAAIDVISATDLAVLFRPDLGGVDNGALWRVAWSTDGDLLYATGTWRVGNRFPVRRWADGGKGKPKDFPGATSLNLRLRSLPSGGFVFVAEVPYIGVVGSDGHLDAERQIPMADYSNIGESFGVSNNGLTVQFAFEPSGGDIAHISLARRALVGGKVPAGTEMSYPVTEIPGLDIRDWSRGYRPTLNGVPLQMTRAHEHALSLTFTPDGKSFLLGTVWNVIRYDSSGKMLWATQVPFDTRGVVVTKDGRLAVAALGDGTIRWYAMDTGQELLAFFPHKDHRRWVAWTPSGYYMSSVDGDTLIGWTVNRGRTDAADFFEARQLRDKLRRPSVVLRTLAETSEKKAVMEADVGYSSSERRSVPDFVKTDIVKSQPPVVRIISPGSDSIVSQDEIEVGYGVRSPSGLPISRLVTLIDGDEVAHAPSTLPVVEAREEFVGTLKVKASRAGEFVLSIFAEAKVDEHDVQSMQQSVRLVRSGITVAAPTPRPNLYALVVGIGDYSIPDLKLAGDFPARDADRFSAEIQQQQGLAFNRVVVHVLKDGNATADNIRAGLDWLKEQIGDVDDIALFFFSGHGVENHLLPVNFDGSVIRSGINKVEVLDALRQANGKRLLFLDACQAGGGLFELEAFVTDAKSDHNRIIAVVSSGADETSSGDAQSNSYFTAAVIEALNGRAARPGSSEVQTADLNAYLSWRVPELSNQKQNSGVYVPFNSKPLRLSIIRRE